MASRAYELYLDSELNEKREILNLLFQNLYLKDEKLVYELNKPFDSILVCNDQHDWLRILGIVRTEIITLLLQEIGNAELQSLVKKTLIKEAC